MADYNRHREGYGSYPERNEGYGRNEGYNRDRQGGYDQQGYGQGNSNYSSRYEGGNTNWNSSRSGGDEDYTRSGDREYGQQQYGSRQDRGQSYGQGGSFGEGRMSSRYGRESQDYAPGGYTNYGGGSGYGGSAWGGGFGGGSYGRSFGSGRSSQYGDAFGGHSGRYGQYGQHSESTYGGDFGRYSGSAYPSGRGEDRGWWDRTTDEVSSWFGDDDAERRRRMDKAGQFRGRGPKGYTRSDDRIREDINDRLSDDAFIDAENIEVSVNNGEVTLTGTVDDRSSKRRAEDVAEAISGVKNVENRIRVSASSNSNWRTGSEQQDAGSSTSGSATTATSTERRKQTTTA